jgi:hypothetical protein
MSPLSHTGTRPSTQSADTSAHSKKQCDIRNSINEKKGAINQGVHKKRPLNRNCEDVGPEMLSPGLLIFVFYHLQTFRQENE